MLAAVASFLNIRALNGSWLLRIDDLDPPREVPGAAADIISTLEAYGLHWDGQVCYQSRRTAAYEEVLGQLVAEGHVYQCSCSRKVISERGEKVYTGHCRNGAIAGRSQYSKRIMVPDQAITWHDMIQGPQSINVSASSGDFIVRRADGFFAYHLAAVIDDASLGVTEVIRGTDLLDATSSQKYLQQVLGLNSPDYGHIPVAVNEKGEKLSKQTGARPLSGKQPEKTLFKILQDLGQKPPVELRHAAVDEVLEWAIKHWQLTGVPRVMSQPVKDDAKQT